jgi:hypothetical protein
MSPQAKSVRVMGIVFVLYALLCATHLGEFWPFSIYPMFSSSAGKPWSRAVVRELPEREVDTFLWGEETLETLPGEPVLLAEGGAIQNDVANYVSKTRAWDEQHVEGLKALLSKHVSPGKKLVVFRVDGELVGKASVSTRAMPVLHITSDEAYLNPLLQPESARIPNSTHPASHEAPHQ